MNKSELIDAIARHADISKAAASKAFDGALTAIKSSLKKSGKVTLVGFGTFSVSKRAARGHTRSWDRSWRARRTMSEG